MLQHSYLYHHPMCCVTSCTTTQQTLPAELHEDTVVHNNNNSNNMNNSIDQLLGKSSPSLTNLQAVTTVASVGVTPGNVTAAGVTANAAMITASMKPFALPKTKDVKSSMKAVADELVVDDSIDEPSLRTKYPLLRWVSYCY
jgi:hypothetical protein